jgi:hypothetical protein
LKPNSRRISETLFFGATLEECHENYGVGPLVHIFRGGGVFFFLEHAGELRIIILIRRRKYRPYIDRDGFKSIHAGGGVHGAEAFS